MDNENKNPLLPEEEAFPAEGMSGTETPEVIAERLARASEEAEGMHHYDYLLLNDVLEDCVDELHQIIQSEHARSWRNKEFISRIQEESRQFK